MLGMEARAMISFAVAAGFASLCFMLRARRLRSGVALGLALMFVGVVTSWAQIPGLYYAWGVTNEITTNSVSAVGIITKVSAGAVHAAALRVDGTVAAWGNNSDFQTNVPPDATNVFAIYAGVRHTLALRSNGTVVAWGRTNAQQTKVPVGLNDVKAIAAGGDHSLALRSNGTVVAWGNNGVLTNVPVTATGVVAIAAGQYASLALRSNGTVVAWGQSTFALTTLPTSLTNIMAISMGQEHCLALQSNGTVIAWGGDNLFGQRSVPSTLSNVVAISAGWLHSLAQKSDGSLVGWGYNIYGQSSIPSGLTNIDSFAAGNSYSLVVDPRPRFATNPPSLVVLTNGGGTNLSASVLSGGTYTLQWSFNGVAIPGATNDSLPISAFNYLKAGNYSLEVSNQVGSVSAGSVVRLLNAPTISVNGVLVPGGEVRRTNSATISLAATTNTFTRLNYTLDGTPPDFASPLYTAPFVVSNSATLRAIAYDAVVLNFSEAAPVTLSVIPSYPLTITAPGGSVSNFPAADLAPNFYLSNTLVTLTATAGNGWQFMNWSGAASGTNPQTSVLMSAAKSVQAIFGTTLNLATNYPVGRVEVSPIAPPFPYGSQITLTAVADPGNYFFGWGGILTNFANPVTLTVTNASGLTALFTSLKPGQCALTLLTSNANGGGILASPSRNVYTNGDVVTLTAYNSTNRIFSSWSGDAVGATNPTTIVMNGNRLVYANFIPGSTPSFFPNFIKLPLARSLSVGSATTLSGQADGPGPIFYQWRRNGVNIVGATNLNLTLPIVTSDEAGMYDLLATNPYGTSTSPGTPVALLGIDFVHSLLGTYRLLIVDCGPGARFDIQTSTNFLGTNWSLLYPFQMTSTRYFFFDPTPASFPQFYYRLYPR